MGAAMLGGAALAGRASQRHSDERQDQEQRLDDLEAQQPPAAPLPIGALNRYDRPQPSLADYDRLRPGCRVGRVATEVIQ